MASFPAEPLTSGNTRVKEARKLARRASRTETRRFLADGPKAVEGALSLLAVLGGPVGLGFHILNISKRSGGFRWQNFFYGPPLAAPLQLSGQGLLGLLVSLFGDK